MKPAQIIRTVVWSPGKLFLEASFIVIQGNTDDRRTTKSTEREGLRRRTEKIFFMHNLRKIKAKKAYKKKESVRDSLREKSHSFPECK